MIPLQVAEQLLGIPLIQGDGLLQQISVILLEIPATSCIFTHFIGDGDGDGDVVEMEMEMVVEIEMELEWAKDRYSIINTDRYLQRVKRQVL